ncbi:hypothetical protein FHX74_002034 [Friedmanniella endophytica]|uniref:TIGR01777 family protein n=1 Tax=Microlunatus kandeliicorticis TaxID=1759536 RepID=A0A7W3P600_9ACTN|nr:TIGR01777 family oxidoreductase [Microlunatus kandeliicorticis]MBA8794415.1 hypothetical protein [Microlunatus kandeliicorticis]
MRFLLAGASGFLGTALRLRLAEDGHEVSRLVRRNPSTPREFFWDPDGGEINQRALDGIDVLIDLAGVGVADRPWTAARKQLIKSSRIGPTSVLAREVARQQREAGRSPLWIQASATGFYGEQSTDVPKDESAPPADDFLAKVVVAWEAAAQPAIDAGAQVIFLRTAPVLDRSGGLLKVLRLPFSMGLGAKLGDGQQRMALISLHDWLRMVIWMVKTRPAPGPYNLTIPEPCTNAEFTKALGHALHRPALLGAPGPVLRRALGELSQQLLGDVNVVPQAALDAGFRFHGPNVRSAIAHALRSGSPGH